MTGLTLINVFIFFSIAERNEHASGMAEVPDFLNGQTGFPPCTSVDTSVLTEDDQNIE